MADPTLAIAPQLSAPDRIQPTATQSDTFVHAAAPYVDPNLGRLADSLGHFNSALQHFGIVDARLSNQRDKEAEKAARDQALAQFEERRIQYGDDALANDIQGKAAWTQNPFYDKVAGQFYGDYLAKKQAQRFDTQRANGQLPLGDPAFNPASAVLADSGANDLPLISGNRAALTAYRERMAHTRDHLTELHQTAAGQAYINQQETMASDTYRQAIMSGAKAGLSGDLLLEHVRGSVDTMSMQQKTAVGSKRFDELQLAAFAEAAKDPAYASAINSVLDAPRKDQLTGNPLPALSANPNLRAQVNHIKDTAFGTLKAAEADQIQSQAQQAASAAFARGDGSINAVRDDTVRGTYGDVKIDDKKLKEQAVQDFLKQSRKDTGGVPNLEAEIPVFINNNMKHPEVSAAIANGVLGVGGANIKSPGDITDKQLQAVINGHTLFNSTYQISPQYAGREYKEEAGMYRAMDALMQRGFTQEDAARAVIWNNSSTGTKLSEEDIKRKGGEIRQKVDDINFNKVWLWGGSATNLGAANDLVMKRAENIYQFSQGKPQDAIDQAVKEIGNEAVVVHGRIVFGSGMEKTDQPHAEAIIGHIYDAHKDDLKSAGVSSPDQLSLAAVGNNRYVLVRADNGRFIRTEKMPVFEVPQEDITMRRTAFERDAKAKAMAEDARIQRQRMEDFKAMQGMSPAGRALYRVDKGLERGYQAYGDALRGADKYLTDKAKAGLKSAVDTLRQLGDNL